MIKPAHASRRRPAARRRPRRRLLEPASVARSAGAPRASWISAGPKTTSGRSPIRRRPRSTVRALPGREIDFVFDRLLDGNRIEDTVTVNGMQTTVSKAAPPITVTWPDAATAMSTPPFSDQVLYNSLPFYGTNDQLRSAQAAGGRIPVVGHGHLHPRPDRPHQRGRRTDARSQPDLRRDRRVFGVVRFAVCTAGADASTAVPSGCMLPVAFSNRVAGPAAVEPFVHVSAGGATLPVVLAGNAGDPTVIFRVARQLPGRLAVGRDDRRDDRRRAVPPTRSAYRWPPTPTPRSPPARARDAPPPRRLRPGRRRDRLTGPVAISAEHLGEGVANGVLDGAERDGRPSSPDIEPITAASRPQGLMAAKRAEVGGDVEGEAVHGDPSLDRHADGGELARAARGPDAGPPALALARQAKARAGADQRLLEVAQVEVQVALVSRRRKIGYPTSCPGPW